MKRNNMKAIYKNIILSLLTSESDPDFPDSRGVYSILKPGVLSAGNDSG